MGSQKSQRNCIRVDYLIFSIYFKVVLLLGPAEPELAILISWPQYSLIYLLVEPDTDVSATLPVNQSAKGRSNKVSHANFVLLLVIPTALRNHMRIVF